MEKEKLPLEKDVDIELEYKLYSIYDKIKKHWKIVLGLVITLFVITAIFYYLKEQKEEKYQKATVLVSQISDKIFSKDYENAKKLISDFEKKYTDTDIYKVVLAYKIIINNEEGKIDKTDAEKLKNLLKTDLKSNITEYLAYSYYKEEKLNEAISLLNTINQENNNYLSAGLLKAFILQKEGKEAEAKNIFTQIKDNKKYNYFSVIARENL